MHALDAEALADSDVTLFGCRANGELVAMGALKQLSPTQAEIKSMHTAEHGRGHGIARAMLTHLLNTAREHGFARVSIETGSSEHFKAARALYESAGFTPCPPFADYRPTPHSVFMTLTIA